MTPHRFFATRKHIQILLAAAIMLTSSQAHAHGPDVSLFYILGGFYFVPYAIGFLVCVSGMRKRYLIYSALMLISGWLLMALAFSLTVSDLVRIILAPTAYLSPWLLVVVSIVQRIKIKRLRQQ